MTIVVDTNVIIAALIQRGIVRELVLGHPGTFATPESCIVEVWENRDDRVSVNGVLKETDLDILMRNGDIIQAKSENLASAVFDSPDYVKFTGEMRDLKSLYDAWRKAEGRVGRDIVSFKTAPHNDILMWLSDNGFGVEVVP